LPLKAETPDVSLLSPTSKKSEAPDKGWE